MNEQVWLNGTEWRPLLDYLRSRASSRQLRLFASGCCRLLSRALKYHSRYWVFPAIEVVEHFADGLVAPHVLEESRQTVIGMQQLSITLGSWPAPDWREAAVITYNHVAIPMVAAQSVTDEPFIVAVTTATETEQIAESEDGWAVALADLIRDIFGNPFRPVTIDPGWLTWNHATVPAIARHVYDDRAFHDLPMLANALEDAGCTNGDLLAHCRGPGPHVRGCWAVELLLGKT